MGGIMKKGGGYGHNVHAHAAYSSSRRRWNVWVLMVIIVVVFGCGLLGVMGLQRLKNARILNLLIKEKDDQILSLHLLLQKEREHVQQVQRKTEEMKLKIYNLRAQNRELNGRLSEMQSTISSLQDEQRTIELAIEEKQNEAKLWRERYIEIKDQNPQVKALTEILRQKEAEIEDLKHHLQLHAKVGSGSTDEPSIIPANIMAKANVSGSEIMTIQSKDKNGDIHETDHEQRNNRADNSKSNSDDASRYRETESSMQSGEKREDNGRLVEDINEMTRNENFDSVESSLESAGNRRSNVSRHEKVETENYDSQKGRSSQTGQEKNEYETEKIGNLGNEEQKPRDEDSEANFTDSKELATMGYAHSKRISKSEGSDNQELGLHKGWVRLEMQENSASGHFRKRGQRSYLRKAKGKRWRPIAKQTEEKRNSGSSGATITTGQRLAEGAVEIGNKLEEGMPENQGKIQDSIMGLRMHNESALKNQQFGIDKKLPEDGQGNTTANLNGYIGENNEENSEDSPPGVMLRNSIKPGDNEDMSQKEAKFDIQVEKGWEVSQTNSSSAGSHISLAEMSKHSKINTVESGSSNKGTMQHTEEDEQPNEQSIMTETTENQNDGKHDNSRGQTEVAATHENPDDIQMENYQETELGTITSTESAHNSEVDKGQTDEPEF